MDYALFWTWERTFLLKTSPTHVQHMSNLLRTVWERKNLCICKEKELLQLLLLREKISMQRQGKRASPAPPIERESIHAYTAWICSSSSHLHIYLISQNYTTLKKAIFDPSTHVTLCHLFFWPLSPHFTCQKIKFLLRKRYRYCLYENNGWYNGGKLLAFAKTIKTMIL